MDQPYSRIADALLDYQYWSPSDPQKEVYDDTGWTFGEVANVQVVRVTDTGVLNAVMESIKSAVRAPGGVTGGGSVFIINHNTDTALATLRYRFKDAKVEVSEEPFELEGRKFNRGSFIYRNAPRNELEAAARELGLTIYAAAAAPSVKTHAVKAPRIAVMHTWLSTQDEGWWRQAFDQVKIPYDYISTQAAARMSDLNAKYDVIIFAPVGSGNPQLIVDGMPMTGNALPWKTTDATPNIGKIDSTDDMRPGLGWSGLANLQAFVRKGGLLITAMDTSNFAIHFGFTPGVSVQPAQRLRVTGSILRSKFVDAASPIAYGYGENLSVYCYEGPIFSLSNINGGRGRRRASEDRDRPTGRGTVDDPDTPQDRPAAETPEEPRAEVWQALPISDEQRRNGRFIIPPPYRPRVILRYGDAKDLLVSGLLDGGTEIAQHAAVIDVPMASGHVLLFSNNPIWRGETQGSYFLVFNAILNFDQLNAGRKLDKK
jgi:hypothetical protein